MTFIKPEYNDPRALFCCRAADKWGDNSFKNLPFSGAMCYPKTVLWFLCFSCLLLLLNSQRFFKHHYELIFERAGIENLNKSVAMANASILIYNRTARPLTLTFRLLQDLHEDCEVFFRAFQFKSNEYRLTALQAGMDLRKVLMLDLGGFDTLLQAAVPPIKWPLRKRVTYTVRNWLPNNQKMPFPYAPAGKWKDIITFYMDNKITTAFDFVLYYRIEDIPDY